MPTRLKRPCTYPGCPALTDGGRCEKHRKQEWSDNRGNSSERGYNRTWQRVREVKLMHNPLCERCERLGRIEPAVMVHHIKALVDGGARLDMDNLQSVCRPCHDVLHGKS